MNLKIAASTFILVVLVASPCCILGGHANAHPPSCTSVISASLKVAHKQSKRVLLKFGASWCKPCHMLDAFLNRPEIWTILGHYFVLSNIDYQEIDSHKDLENSGAREWLLKEGVRPGLPGLVVLDEKGAAVSSSYKSSNGVGEGGWSFSGPPFNYNEIAGFLHMLNEGAPRMTVDELSRIRKVLEDDIQKSSTE